MERYLINNNKYFVLAGSCNESDSESDDAPNSLNNTSEWRETDSKYFLKLLESTNVQASIDKHLQSSSTDRQPINKVDLETHEINPAPDNSTI